ncbi:MAG: glycosyltransferase [Clostridia bacterium]|nr:glycosyltransferase [Clostridia bacterium]
MLFSIITVALNAENLILDTLNSVLGQTYKDFEIIVKDGESKDKTLEKIPKDDRIKVVCKKDKGIYDAMNQAIYEAKGKYLIFMNCGDKFYSNDILSYVAKELEGVNADIIYGNRYSKSCGEYKYLSKPSKRFFYSGTICHQASFISKDLFEKIGCYDDTLKIASDWKFFLDAKINGAKFYHCDKIFCEFLDGGVSETKEGETLSNIERKAVIKDRYNVFERVVFSAIKKIRNLI